MLWENLREEEFNDAIKSCCITDTAATNPCCPIFPVMCYMKRRPTLFSIIP